MKDEDIQNDSFPFLFFFFFLNSRFFPMHMEACIDGAHAEKKQLKLVWESKKTEEESNRKKKVKHNLINYSKKNLNTYYYLVQLVIIIFIITFINNKNLI